MSALLEPMGPATLPDVAPEFDQVQRFWDPRTAHWTAKLLPGESYATVGEEAIATVVGSCVCACVRDTSRRIGGMNHFMLPVDRPDHPVRWPIADDRSAMRFGSRVMHALLERIHRMGVRREHLELKLFGGARIVNSAIDSSARNVAFVRSYCALEGLKVVAEDLGGFVPRHVLYFPSSGRAVIKRLRAVLDPAVAAGEIRYRESLTARSYATDVELFD